TGSLIYVLAEDVTKEALDICGREGTAAEQAAIAAAKKAGNSAGDQVKAGDAAFKAAVQQCAQQLVKQFPDIGLPRPDNPVFYCLLILLPLTVLAMLLVTVFVHRGVRLRWVAVPQAVLAAFWCAGLAGASSLRLTPATLAVLPVVLGLSTDYGLQAANRLAEV